MAQIDVILSEDVLNLGEAGEVVRVKPGFARNYLLPRGKAIVATKAKVAEIEHHKRIIAEKVAREMKNLEAVKKAMEKVELTVEMQAGTEGKLFGSVTSAAIASLPSSFFCGNDDERETSQTGKKVWCNLYLGFSF